MKYFIIDTVNNLIFIPLSNKYGNIIEYTYTELKNFEKIRMHSFSLCSKRNAKNIYAWTSTDHVNMHEIIYGKKAMRGFRLDHINSHGLDNRSCNLRLLTDAENSFNRKPSSDDYLGVNFHVGSNKWTSEILYKGERYHLGYFNTPEEVAKQYDIYSELFYPGIRYHLNQINGKDSLTKKEIEDIRNNPDKYKALFENRKRNLPKNISKSKEGFRFERVEKIYFVNREEAEEYLKDVKEKFPEIASLKKLEIQENKSENGDEISIRLKFSKYNEYMDPLLELKKEVEDFMQFMEIRRRERVIAKIDEYRNKDGIATIKVFHGDTDSYYDVQLDDEDWKLLVFYNWYDNKGYATNKISVLCILRYFQDVFLLSMLIVAL